MPALIGAMRGWKWRTTRSSSTCRMGYCSAFPRLSQRGQAPTAGAGPPSEAGAPPSSRVVAHALRSATRACTRLRTHGTRLRTHARNQEREGNHSAMGVRCRVQTRTREDRKMGAHKTRGPTKKSGVARQIGSYIAQCKRCGCVYSLLLCVRCVCVTKCANCYKRKAPFSNSPPNGSPPAPAFCTSSPQQDHNILRNLSVDTSSPTGATLSLATAIADGRSLDIPGLLSGAPRRSHARACASCQCCPATTARTRRHTSQSPPTRKGGGRGESTRASCGRGRRTRCSAQCSRATSPSPTRSGTRRWRVISAPRWAAPPSSGGTR